MRYLFSFTMTRQRFNKTNMMTIPTSTPAIMIPEYIKVNIDLNQKVHLEYLKVIYGNYEGKGGAGY